MHTLLPYDDFRVAALCLTNGLLRQQIADCVEILDIIHEVDGNTGKYNDPTVKAWEGSELQLCEFGLCCVEVAVARSHPKGLTDATAQNWLKLEKHLDLASDGDLERPSWFGDDRVHREYQGLLRHFDPEHYEHVFPNVATCEPERFRFPLEIVSV